MSERRHPAARMLRFSPLILSLSLLVLRIGTDHTHDAMTFDDLALITHSLDRRSHLHFYFSFENRTEPEFSLQNRKHFRLTIGDGDRVLEVR